MEDDAIQFFQSLLMKNIQFYFIKIFGAELMVIEMLVRNSCFAYYVIKKLLYCALMCFLGASFEKSHEPFDKKKRNEKILLIRS